MTILKLPKPTGDDTYWFGEPGCGFTPAIFRRHANHRGEANRWFVSLGRDGIVFENGTIKEFPTVAMAFEFLRERFST